MLALIGAWFHVSQHFVPFLEVLGVTATPIAAVVCCCYFFADDGEAVAIARLASRNKELNTLVWLLGSIIGYSSQVRGGFLLPAPALEGYLAALAIWW